MKKIFLSLLAPALLFTACAPRSGASGDGLSGVVTAVGSSSLERVMGTLGEQFHIDHPGVTVSVEGGGSGAGIEAAASGMADVGLSSRALTQGELDKGLVETILALDGIVLIVNGDNPVSDLTTEQVADLFTGRLANWSQVGGNDLAVACIGREAGSGTRDGFESATGTADTCLLAQELTSSGGVVEAVRSSPNAVGYTSLSAVEGQEGVKTVTVNGAPCTEDALLDGSYPLQRPFVLVTQAGAKQSEAVRAFFQWAASPAAAELIRGAGAVPAAAVKEKEAAP